MCQWSHFIPPTNNGDTNVGTTAASATGNPSCRITGVHCDVLNGGPLGGPIVHPNSAKIPAGQINVDPVEDLRFGVS